MRYKINNSPAEDADLTDEKVLATHRWVWDEGSSGAMYEFCTRCLAYKDEAERNQFHGPMACTA